MTLCFFSTLNEGLIIKTGNARIINVSSVAHTFCKQLKLDDLTFDRDPEDTKFLSIYGVTKLCNILFSKELARKLETLGELCLLSLSALKEGVMVLLFNLVEWILESHVNPDTCMLIFFFYFCRLSMYLFILLFVYVIHFRVIEKISSLSHRARLFIGAHLYQDFGLK